MEGKTSGARGLDLTHMLSIKIRKEEKNGGKETCGQRGSQWEKGQDKSAALYCREKHLTFVPGDMSSFR